MRQITSRIVVLSLALVAFAACSEPMVPELEVDNIPVLDQEPAYEFSAMVESINYGDGVVAHHDPRPIGDPEFNSFTWPTWNNDIGAWPADTSRAHSIGSWSVATPQAGETLTVNFRVEWINGETEKPLDFVPMVAAEMRYYGPKDSDHSVSYPSTNIQSVGEREFQVEYTIPDKEGLYVLLLITGIEGICNAPGIKSVLLGSAKFDGAGYVAYEYHGKSLFTTTCRKILPRYSVVS